ncbi:polyprenyl synthetase family protein [Paracoccaceae bacterium]|nr:polyprenyl synthetase family protein [Paracoccaceae bacterium]
MTTSISKLSDLLSEKIRATNQVIEENLISKETAIIGDIASHLINSGGKRIRPLLTLAVSELFDYQEDKDTFLAAAIEYIHSATLLHDDVIDRSQKRRGLKTANIIWTNKYSVLVGDFLFSRAFQLMVRTGSLRIMKTLSDASAIISQGEILQVGIEKKLDASEEDYLKVIKGKTSALFSAACQAGAEITKASDAHIEALRKYGESIGTSFQLIDDYLDYLGNEKQMGKNKGNDFFEKKVTLPIIHAYEKSSKAEKKIIKEIFRKPAPNYSDLNIFLEIMEKKKSLIFTKTQATIWTERSIKALKIIEDSAIKTLLIELAQEILDRAS